MLQISQIQRVTLIRRLADIKPHMMPFTSLLFKVIRLQKDTHEKSSLADALKRGHVWLCVHWLLKLKCIYSIDMAQGWVVHARLDWFCMHARLRFCNQGLEEQSHRRAVFCEGSLTACCPWLECISRSQFEKRSALLALPSQCEVHHVTQHGWFTVRKPAWINIM